MINTNTNTAGIAFKNPEHVRDILKRLVEHNELFKEQIIQLKTSDDRVYTLTRDKYNNYLDILKDELHVISNISNPVKFIQNRLNTNEIVAQHLYESLQQTKDWE